MPSRDFRFGLNLIPNQSRTDLRKVARQAEDLGYDVLSVSDYVTLSLPQAGINRWTTLPPPLALLTAAEVTSRLKLATYALNANLYKPALLVRDTIALQDLTDDRFELGIGVGYIQDDFVAAEVGERPAGERISHLEHTVAEFRRLIRGPVPPLLIGNSISERVQKLAAAEADIISFTGARGKSEFSMAKLLTSDDLAARCETIRASLGERASHVEFNTLVHAMSLVEDRSAVPAFPNVEALSPQQSHQVPGILSGSPSAIAEDLHRHRETYGISYFTIRSPNMADFAKVINKVR